MTNEELMKEALGLTEVHTVDSTTVILNESTGELRVVVIVSDVTEDDYDDLYVLALQAFVPLIINDVVYVAYVECLTRQDDGTVKYVLVEDE